MINTSTAVALTSNGRASATAPAASRPAFHPTTTRRTRDAVLCGGGTANLRRCNRGCGPHEHAGQVSVILLGEYASELHDVCRVGIPIDEDDDLSYRFHPGGVINRRCSRLLCRAHGNPPLIQLVSSQARSSA